MIGKFEQQSDFIKKNDDQRTKISCQQIVADKTLTQRFQSWI